MRNHRFGIAAAGVIATAALAAGVATAATSAGSATAVPFKASYAGTAVVKVDGNVADITATGKGKGTLIGVGKITGKGKGDSSVQPCVPFTGTGALIGPGTTKLTFKVVAGLERLRRRGRPGLQHQRQGHRHQRLRKARERPRHAQDHRRLRPGPGHVHGQVQPER